MVDDGKGVGLRHKALSSPISRRPESTLETDSKDTGGLTESRKKIAFKASHLLVSLVLVWFW
jgi:hypothetical protein